MKQKVRYVNLTKKEIARRFSEYNAIYFNNEIAKPARFELFTPSKNILGLTRDIFNTKTGRHTAALHISKRYRWTDENLKHVILHEMIHLHICDYLRPLRWWEKLFPFLLVQHDADFKSEMRMLNERYNLNIQTSFPEMRKYRIY